MADRSGLSDALTSADALSMLYAVFLYGVNIPGMRGGIWLSEEKVRASLQRLPPWLTFQQIAGRPDSLVLAAAEPTTEDSVRRAAGEALGCRCVAVAATTVARVVDSAIAALRPLGDSAAAPHRITIDDAEWEWCLVLTSEPLPVAATIDTAAWISRSTANAVGLAVLERRALLARKRRRTPNGVRVMLGAALIDPWAPVLASHGVEMACLTSRTLNRVARVAAVTRVERSGRQ
jgi:hypothetical protein